MPRGSCCEACNKGLSACAQINDWVVKNQAGEDGQLPKFPSEADGGSKIFLEPQAPVEEPPAAKKGKGKQPGRPASATPKGKDPRKKGAPAGTLILRQFIAPMFMI